MPVEYLDLSAESKAEQAKHADALRRLELKQRARNIVVPTDLGEIKSRLRELGQPVTLFGEGPADRRERLRETIAALELDDGQLSKMQELMSRKRTPLTGKQTDAVPAHAKESVFSPATDAMVEVRQFLAGYSFERARERIVRTNRIRSSEQEQLEEDRVAAELFAHSREVAINASQFVDERPATCVRFSPRGNLLATSALGTSVKLWDSANMRAVQELKGHEERVKAVAWHPDPGVELLASASADGTCILWYDCGCWVSVAHSVGMSL